MMVAGDRGMLWGRHSEKGKCETFFNFFKFFKFNHPTCDSEPSAAAAGSAVADFPLNIGGGAGVMRKLMIKMVMGIENRFSVFS